MCSFRLYDGSIDAHEGTIGMFQGVVSCCMVSPNMMAAIAALFPSPKQIVPFCGSIDSRIACFDPHAKPLSSAMGPPKQIVAFHGSIDA